MVHVLKKKWMLKLHTTRNESNITYQNLWNVAKDAFQTK